jgi:curved DNA-binding protein CbpA
MAEGAATHYEVLGVPPTATQATLRDAYVVLARRHHPDVAGGDAARMRAINAAWTTLGDPERRARYDRSLAGWPAAGATESADDDTSAVLDDLLADLDDDTPIGTTVRLPGWMSLVPVGLFVLSIASFALGALLGAPALIGAAITAFLLSCLLFIAAPFVALLASRRGAR